MNCRERFNAVMHFEPADRLSLKWEFGYWVSTIRRWYSEGLPERYGIAGNPNQGYADSVAGTGAWWGSPPLRFATCGDIDQYFTFDKPYTHIPLENWIFPLYEERIVAEDDDKITVVDKWGVTQAKSRDPQSPPHFIGWPVKTREDWERIKAERFRPNAADRLPPNWPALVSEFHTRNYPLSIAGTPTGYYGSLRFLIGEVNTLSAYYDDPQLIHTILNDLTEFWISLYDPVLQEVKPDSAEMWEDMCYNSGPMISPQMFREFMLPYYQRLTRFFNDHGIDIIVVDTDGRCDSLIPLFVEGGVTCLLPMEARAGMDPLKVREAFPRLRFCGAIDKYAVAAGREVLLRELETKVRPLLHQGGYIPYVDHNVPPDVSWANYKAYREQLNDIIDERR